jgi:hypothetical protein
MKGIVKLGFLLAALASLITTTVRADEVTEWNQIMFKAALLAMPPTSPLVMTRNAAIVQASVFDAVNGIERRYSPIHVDAVAPRGASRRAAVVQAAYASLVRLYPAWSGCIPASRAHSIKNAQPHWPRSQVESQLRTACPLRGGSPGGSSLPTQSGPGVAPTVSVRHYRHF